MQKVALHFFVELGEHLARLADGSTQNALVKTLVASFAVEQLVQHLLASYKELKSCRTAGDELLRLNSLFRRRVEGELRGDDPVDTELHVTLFQVTNQLNRFRTLLLEALQREPVFRVTQTAGYETLTLLTQAERTFPESARMKFRADVVAEIRESGKCLAYDTPTAAGFHSIRALELVMHDYYVAVCKPAKPKKLVNWKAYISALKNDHLKKGGKAAAKVIAILEDMAASDRNLIMHPKRVLKFDEALTLFKQCESAMISMASKLPRDKQQYANELGELGIGYEPVQRENAELRLGAGQG